MCDRCSVLEERIAFLEGELQAQLRQDQIMALKRRFRLSPVEAQIVLRLYAAGRPVAHWSLVDEFIGNPDGEWALNSLKVRIHSIRKRLGFDAIDTAHGHGYQITALGKALVYNALGKTLEVA